MAQVLAAVDLTPLGRKVADRGRMIAEGLGAELSLVHVVEPLGETFIGADVARLLFDQRKRAVEELAEWCGSRSEVPVNVTVLKGSPAWEIVRLGKKSELVVVGSSSLDSEGVGPTSLRVVEGHRGDVLVVRRQPRVPYRRIVVATDMSEASVAGVEFALRMAPEADITLVHGLPSRFDTYMAEAGMFPEEIEAVRDQRRHAGEEALDSFGSRWGERVRTVISEGPPGAVVQEVARRRSADLVVVSSRGAGATKMVLLGTIAARVLESVPTDVAIARVPGEFRRP